MLVHADWQMVSGITKDRTAFSSGSKRPVRFCSTAVTPQLRVVSTLIRLNPKIFISHWIRELKISSRKSYKKISLFLYLQCHTARYVMINVIFRTLRTTTSSVSAITHTYNILYTVCWSVITHTVYRLMLRILEYPEMEIYFYIN